MSAPRHFLSLMDLSPDQALAVIDDALRMKQHAQPADGQRLNGTSMALIFEKSSTRTRVSAEVAMSQLGGNALFLSPRDSQLGRGEPIADSARVISRMVDFVFIRTFDHSIIETFAAHSRVPVINALTDFNHPCQLLADVLTYQEHRGAIQGKKVAWIGDGNNMCHSYMYAAKLFDFQLHIACPAGYAPAAQASGDCADNIQLCDTPEEAVTGADLVVTDVWASMGQEEEQQARIQAFADYEVTPLLMQQAASDALFMHCLPAHRGEEVSADVIDGPQSVVWDEAENRLHSLKALLCHLHAGQS